MIGVRLLLDDTPVALSVQPKLFLFETAGTSGRNAVATPELAAAAEALAQVVELINYLHRSKHRVA